MKYCSICGYCNDDNAKFCGGCGRPIQTTTSTSQNTSNPSWVDHINDYVGNDRPTDLNWKVLFSDVLKKHSKSEAENLFICGTKTTTPTLDSVSQHWFHPWLYSRVFLMFVVTFSLLYVCCTLFGNTNAIPGLIVVGSFTVPLSGLIAISPFLNAYILFYCIALYFSIIWGLFFYYLFKTEQVKLRTTIFLFLRLKF